MASLVLSRSCSCSLALSFCVCVCVCVCLCLCMAFLNQCPEAEASFPARAIRRCKISEISKHKHKHKHKHKYTHTHTHKYTNTQTQTYTHITSHTDISLLRISYSICLQYESILRAASVTQPLSGRVAYSGADWYHVQTETRKVLSHATGERGAMRASTWHSTHALHALGRK